MGDLLISSLIVWALGRVLKKKADMPPPPVDRMYTNDQLPQQNNIRPNSNFGPASGTPGIPATGPESTQRNPYKGGYV